MRYDGKKYVYFRLSHVLSNGRMSGSVEEGREAGAERTFAH